MMVCSNFQPLASASSLTGPGILVTSKSYWYAFPKLDGSAGFLKPKATPFSFLNKTFPLNALFSKLKFGAGRIPALRSCSWMISLYLTVRSGSTSQIFAEYRLVVFSYEAAP